VEVELEIQHNVEGFRESFVLTQSALSRVYYPFPRQNFVLWQESCEIMNRYLKSFSTLLQC